MPISVPILIASAPSESQPSVSWRRARERYRLQAKRYGKENAIGREKIQQFVGALTEKGSSKGVFVTTSSFSKGAIEYASKVPQRVILIDGEQLANFMIQYGVGVRTERTIDIKKTDADYFDENAE